MSEDSIAPPLLNDVSGPCEFCCNSSFNRSSMTIDGDDHDSIDPLMIRSGVSGGASGCVQNDFDFLLSQFDPKELMVVQDVYREFHIDPANPNPSAEACISYVVQAKGDQQHQQQQQSMELDNIFDMQDLQLLIGYPEKNSTSQAMINQRYQIMRHALNKDNDLLPRPESTVYEYFNMFRGKIRLEMQNRAMMSVEHFVDTVDPGQIDQRIQEEKDHLLDFWNKQVIQRTNLMFQPEKSYRFQENWPPLLMNVPEEYFSSDELQGDAPPPSTAAAVIGQPELVGPPRKPRRRRRRTRLTRRKGGGRSKQRYDKSRPKREQEVFCLDQLIDSISTGSLILEAETEQQPTSQPSSSSSSSSSPPTTSNVESDATIKVSGPDDDDDPEEATVPVHTHNNNNNENNDSPIQIQQWEYVTYVQSPAHRPPSSTDLSNESEQALQPWFDDSTPPPPSMVHHQQEEEAAAAATAAIAEEETVNVTFIYDETDTGNNNSSRSNDRLQINLFDLGLKKEEELSTNDVCGGNSGIVETFDDDEPEPEPVPLLSVMVSLDQYIADPRPLFQRCNQLFEMIKSRNPEINPAAAVGDFRSTLEQLKLVELGEQSGGYDPFLLYYESWIACYLDGEYSKAMRLCERIAYPDQLHRPMQEIWDHSLEMLESIRRNNQKLSSVQRFRLKQKHEYPDTIWDGRRVKYGMSVLHKKVLIFFYHNYSKNPTSAQKDRLASMVNASSAHVSTFFKNRRSRSGDTRKGGRTLKQEITESEWQILEEMLKSES